ncbi:hypothetical protein BOVMAS33_14510 [Streptococcus uberis]
MSTITLVLNEQEDQLDYEVGIKALERFESTPIKYSIDDVIMELENEL